MRRRHAISPGHYQDLGISSLTRHTSAWNIILSVACKLLCCTFTHSSTNVTLGCTYMRCNMVCHVGCTRGQRGKFSPPPSAQLQPAVPPPSEPKVQRMFLRSDDGSLVLNHPAGCLWCSDPWHHTGHSAAQDIAYPILGDTQCCTSKGFEFSCQGFYQRLLSCTRCTSKDGPLMYASTRNTDDMRPPPLHTQHA